MAVGLAQKKGQSHRIHIAPVIRKSQASVFPGSCALTKLQLRAAFLFGLTNSTGLDRIEENSRLVPLQIRRLILSPLYHIPLLSLSPSYLPAPSLVSSIFCSQRHFHAFILVHKPPAVIIFTLLSTVKLNSYCIKKNQDWHWDDPQIQCLPFTVNFCRLNPHLVVLLSQEEVGRTFPSRPDLSLGL